MFTDMISSLLKNITFECHSCGQRSGIERIAEGRDEFKRALPDPNAPKEVTVYCEHCDSPNTIDISFLL